MDLSLTLIVAFTSLTFLLAGLVKGGIGLGLPPVAMGLLTLVMPPTQAAALLVVPSLVTNVWQLVAGPQLRSLLSRLWTLLVGICIGTWLGGKVLGIGSHPGATMALGLALAAYAIFGLFKVALPEPGVREAWLSPVIGACTGILAAATGVFAIPAVPYLQAIGLAKDELVQALGLSFTVSTVALAIGLAGQGSLHASVFWASVFALAPAVAGMIIGQKIRDRVAAPTFRLWFFVGLLLLGGHLTVSALR